MALPASAKKWCGCDTILAVPSQQRCAIILTIRKALLIRTSNRAETLSLRERLIEEKVSAALRKATVQWRTQQIQLIYNL